MGKEMTIGVAELAAALGRSEGWLKVNHRKLTERHDMPPRLPGGLVWSRAAISVWMMSFGQSAENRSTIYETEILRQRQQLMDAFARAA